jgi:hypothetical protein
MSVDARNEDTIKVTKERLDKLAQKYAKFFTKTVSKFDLFEKKKER